MYTNMEELLPTITFDLDLCHDRRDTQSCRKTPKNSDTPKFAVITLKVEQGGFTLE